MSKLTLEEAISHCLEVANSKEMEAEFETDYVCYFMTDKEREECKECAADHRQLAEWLTELKEAKRLLKAAVEDIHQDKCDTCTQEIDCKFCYCEGLYEWRYEAEALALIGKDTNVPASADDTNVGHKSGGWISCEERLPEPDTMVIVASYGSDIVIPEGSETVEECCERLKKECVRVTLGFIGSDGWYGSDYFPLIVTPSFWQPLPEPPKE